MYFSLTVVSALLATSVSASSLGLMRRQYPDCATPCITNVDYHGCSASSIPCLCKNSDYVKETTACMVQSCSGDDLQQALGVAEGLCESVGVTLQSSDVLPATSAASGGSAAAVSATTTSAGTSSSSTGTSSDASNTALNLNGFTALTGIAAGGLVALLL